MNKLLKTFIVSISFISSAAFAQNNFFDGYIKACSHSELYNKFQKELCNSFVDTKGLSSCKPGKVVLPSDMGGKLILSKNEGEFTLFEVKLDKPADFAGNQVLAIEQWTGHDNGIWGTALVLQAKTLKEANAHIKQSGVKFKHEKSEVLDRVGAEVVKGRDDRIRIMCDISN